ncbi:MAG: UDP-N-acetylmuramoyl-L-alanyl-D-glutamate--2,6-diaminopimelate ligase, partial [Myxococcota bacterium]
NSVVVVDREISEGLKFGDYIMVENIIDAMNTIAAKYYNYPFREMKMIGVTGTNGKSSITYLVESVGLASKMNVGVIGTINYRYKDKILPAPNTTPEALVLMRLLREMRDANTDLLVMEVSSHGLALRRTAALKFDVVIFTNLSRDHLDFHRDMEEYFNAKRLLFQREYSKDENSAAIINVDDEYGKRLKGESFPKIFGYSLQNRNEFIHCLRYEIGGESIKADISIDGKIIGIKSHLIGLHNLYNIMATAGAMYMSGCGLEDIAKGISNLEYVPGRLQKVKNDFGIRCLVDYAHSDDSLRNVLSALSGLGHNRIITVFGAGGDRDRGKRPLMAKAVCEFSDVVIITSDNPRTEDPGRIIEDIEMGVDKSFIKIDSDELKGANSKVYTIIENRAEAIRRAVMSAVSGDIILIAGKGHEDYIIEGTQKRYFSDVEEAERAFAMKRGEL